MNNKVINLLMLAAGAAIGSAVTWKVVKTKYERIADEEIASMKKYYEGQNKVEKVEPEKVEPKRVAPVPIIDPLEKEKIAYNNMVKDCGYISEEGGPVNVGLKPYVISPDEFDELDNYQTMTLFYYADGILADEEQEVIEDIDGCIGVEALKHFGEYADDAVYVRNDRQRIDYEVLLDERKFYPERPDIRVDE